ncbi:hypothetical protein [Streptomyces sp. NPDC012689]|uniref:hypothetical protein n=1 Tax=Streptomyces sp. NPDC012689 TaxID=3364843 RepID=UPI00368DB9F5
MRNRFTSAAVCLALGLTGWTVATGSAAATERNGDRNAVVTAAPYSTGTHGDEHTGWPGQASTPVPVPPAVTELICGIQQSIPYPVQIPHCKQVNGWQ